MGGGVWDFGDRIVVQYAPILAVCAAVLYECVELRFYRYCIAGG
jgi:hypothetical protein